MLSAYRRSGADPPFGDLRGYHGVGMEGYFWRITDARAGVDAVVLVGVNRDERGRSWGTVGLAAHPGGRQRVIVAEHAQAGRRGVHVSAHGRRSLAQARSARLVVGAVSCRAMDDATRRELESVVTRALAEDVGDGDLTSLATVPQGVRARATIAQKEPGVIFGLEAAEHVFVTLDGRAQLERLTKEGVWREQGPVLRVDCDAQAILAAERTALNLLQQLSGVATQTARFVRAVEGTGARILDTRKTTPGMRLLEKAAVRAGGGVNHRIGLWDQILIKENHASMAGGVRQAVEQARASHPGVPLEVECRSPADVDEALAAGATRLLLDNMTPAELRVAIDQVAGRAELEASGGVTLATVREVAESGVQFVSVGALTHSAHALDLSLLLEPL